MHKCAKTAHFFAWNFHHPREITHGRQYILYCKFSFGFFCNHGRIDQQASIRTLEKSAGASGMSWGRAGWCVAGGEARELAGRCEFGRAAEMSQLEPNTAKQSTATRKTKVATLDDSEFALTHSQTWSLLDLNDLQ